ncbi:RICIN domain-containing protein [Streptomyces sp. NBC_01236]|uniref:RICIN domain-containing protein n=1 Tax=Streptomyces sp. NBC_01236 TaxID=2903789 RepID=UPI002E0F070B|nr:RICIN domain-containing protein [Streptomyces sp. NBC_01236]
MSPHSHTARLRGLLRRAAVQCAVLCLAVAGLAGVGRSAAPLPAEPTAVSTNQIGVTPASMGWASWNSFASTIDYATIKAQADALVSSGMAAAGYNYVNIDEGWWEGARDSSGNITVDTAKWPGGMKAIADYIHSKGLKAGIYTDAGKNGCGYYYPTTQPAAPNTGMEGHNQQDLQAFQNWGFDFVKIDWCGGDAEGLDQETTYKAIRDANAAATAVTGHSLVLSLCEWGTGNPWNWAAGTGDMWRTSTDIVFWGNNPSMSNILANFDKSLHPAAQHTGYYNDPDMMTVGMTGLSAAQNRTHMGLWAISGAPLLAGNNLATMSSTTASILTNSEVIAIDQDARGLQGVKVAEDSTGLQVYSKILSGTGKRAVLLLNRTSAAANITARWADMGLTTASAAVRNVWSASNAGSYATSYTTSVPAGEGVLLTVSGTEGSGTTYEDTTSATTPTFTGVTTAAAGTKLVDITYANSGSTARKATLQVNGQYTQTLAFPPTGSSTTYRTVSVLASMGKGSNTLTFGTSGTAPDIDAVAVRAIPGTNGTAVVGTGSGRCLDFFKSSITNNTQAELWDCGGGQNQTFTYTSRSELVVYGNKCLDAYNSGTANGTKVVLWDCNGGTNQKWTVNSNGTITNNVSGLCLDVYNNGTANGALIDLWSCNGGTNQQWTRN